MECGIVLHGSNILGAEEAMEEVLRAGFRSFEYSCGHVKKLEDAGRGSFESAAGTASSLGLEPVQLHGPSLEAGFDLGSPDEVIRRRSIERSSLWIQHCSDLGVPVMVEHGCEYHDDFDATMENMKSSFADLARAASEHGVRIAIENEFDPRAMARRGSGREMVVPARVGCMMAELLEVVNDVDPDNLGVCLDFGHANLQRPLFPLEVAIRELGDLLLATHIHDNEGQSDQHMIPLMGNIDWEPTMEALSQVGYSRPLILELGGISVGDSKIRENRLRLYRCAGLEITRDF